LTEAADVFELTVENILYGGDELLYIIHKIIVAISREGHIPDLLKTGLLTPIFKNKGSKLHVAYLLVWLILLLYQFYNQLYLKICN
jgi:hypothetical protein